MQAMVKTDTLPFKGDSAILFRFVPGRLMFYSPFKGNEHSIRQAAQLIEQYRKEITAGQAFITVRGFCGSYPTKQQNLRAAKNRSNQVKSWFITHHGMKEAYYRTANSTSSYKGIKDVVALLGLQWAEGYEPQPLPVQADTVPPVPADTLSVQSPVQADSVAQVPAPADTLPQALPADTPRTVVTVPTEAEPELMEGRWAIKTNLLYYLALMPSLEVEYRFNDRWSVNLEGNMAWWHNNGKHRYYQLATISPEGRYWFKTRKPWHGHYVGLFGGVGWYDLENKGTGYRGEGQFVGLSYGYMFPVGKYFSLEAGLGVGYLHTKYDKYEPLDGHYVFQEKKRLNYFGPLKLKLALVWRIETWLLNRKGGKR